MSKESCQRTTRRLLTRTNPRLSRRLWWIWFNSTETQLCSSGPSSRSNSLYLKSSRSSFTPNSALLPSWALVNSLRPPLTSLQPRSQSVCPIKSRRSKSKAWRCPTACFKTVLTSRFPLNHEISLQSRLLKPTQGRKPLPSSQSTPLVQNRCLITPFFQWIHRWATSQAYLTNDLQGTHLPPWRPSKVKRSTTEALADRL